MSETKSNSKKPKMPEIKLVEVHGKNLTTTTLIISDLFKRKHSDVINGLESLINDGTIAQRDYSLSEYKDASGKSNKMYVLNERGFLISMPFIGGVKSRAGQVKLVDEFLRLHKLQNQEGRKEAIQYKRDTARPMTDMLTFIRDGLGKKTIGNVHCKNEHLFCNRALNGKWEEIAEGSICTYDAILLGKIRQHNTLLMTRHLKQADRRKLLDDFVAQYRAKNPKQDLIEEPKAPYSVRRLGIG